MGTMTGVGRVSVRLVGRLIRVVVPAAVPAMMVMAVAVAVGRADDAGPVVTVDVPGWVDAAKPLNDEAVFRTGYVPFKAHYDSEIRKIGREAMRMRSGYILDLLDDASLEVTGFGWDDGRAGFKQKYLVGNRDSDGELSVTWTAGRELFPIIFIAMDDVGTTGEEAIGIYRNDQHLATYFMGDRQSLDYVYPYDASRARNHGDIPMAPRMERGKLIGVALRQRQKFENGDRLRIVAETPGQYQMSALMLVPRPDTIEMSEHRILRPRVKVWDVERLPEGRRGSLQFAWVTRMPSRCSLLWSTDRGDIEAGRGHLVQGQRYGENHQQFVEVELQPGTTVYYRILAESNDGRRVATAIESYTHAERSSQSARGRISLHGVDPVEVGPTAAYGSVPLNEGELHDLEAVRLVRGEGDEPVAAQFRAVAHHDDDSVRWLGVDFTAEPGASYAVEYGPTVRGAAEGAGLRLTRSDGEIAVSNEAVEVRFSRGASAGLARLDVKNLANPVSLDSDGLRLTMTGADGRRFVAGAPERLEVEHAGSQHVTVRAEGHFVASDGEPLMHYILRWKLYAAQPGVSLELTVGNDRDEDKYASFPPDGPRTSGDYANDKPLNWYFVNIRDLYLEMELPGQGDVSVGLDGELASREAAGLRLFQRDEHTLLDESGGVSPARFVEDRSGRVPTIVEETDLSVKARLDGRVLWQGGSGAIGVKFDRFWQQYPKSYEWVDQTLRIGIMPTFSEAYYPTHRLDETTGTLDRYSDTSRLFFYLRQGLYRFMYGTQKTHQLSILFGEEAKQRLSADRVIPPAALFMPDPTYNCSTFAVGDFLKIKADEGRYPAVNAWMDDFLAAYVEGRGFGMLNFGDVWGERVRHWQNLQVDFSQAASREFWRTGDRDWLSVAYEAAMHFVDVDTVHYGRNRGSQAVHAIAHTGGEYLWQEGLKVAGYPHSLPTNHMSVRGIRNLALISGSERMRRSVDAFSSLISGSAASHLKSTMGNRGYNIYNSFACYELEANPFDLNAATIAFERMFTDLDPYNPEYTSVPRGYHRATGDDRVLAVRRAGALNLDRTYTPYWDEQLKLSFRGIQDPNRRIYSAPSGVGAEAYLLTGESKYRTMFEENTAYGLAAPQNNWGPNPAHMVQFLGERSSMTDIAMSSLTWYLDAAGIETVEPRELPQATVETLEAWGEADRLP